ncbi:MAG: polyprenyl synthetase family protein [Anaerolineales bacterium]|nr:polyprenyl synthetase family protein [Anaerolineales bacterium]
MNAIYPAAIQLLLEQPAAAQWPLLQRVLQQANGKPPVAWDFPIAGCLAAGGPAKAATPAVAAITCAHIAIILIDDILDDDPRGEYRTLGSGRAANLASGLGSLGQHMLEAYPCQQPSLAIAALGQMMGNTAYGQDLDVQNPHSEEGYWAVAKAKSSPYFATALSLGGLYGGADGALTEALGQFGAVFGEVMQIHDDLNDCLAEPANVDWLQGRAPLPLLFAELVPHPLQQRFVQLRSQVQDPEALREAQQILVSSGAISYCVNELLTRQRQLETSLAAMPLANPVPLQQILAQAIAPIEHLFSSVGVVR